MKADRRKSNPKRPVSTGKDLKRKREGDDLDSLTNRVKDLDTTAAPSSLFNDLPLSSVSKDGLAASHFKSLTPIQAKGIPAALKGADILGAAKTGSGKTLAFLVPVLENLYRRRWTEFDGVGALILSPTRELAIQIFEVLRKIGRYHAFSAGLVIGGKSLQEERERMGRMNILIATPGRMLQHMDQTADLDIGNLQILVLDEADRCMDMGFKDTMDAIIEHLPHERQTLLFSATQTKRVSDLARLSLRDPTFLSVDEAAASATPSKLLQNYTVVSLPDKLDTLWSFLRANVKKKIIVFLSSGKEVRFVYEAFRHLQPGLTLLHLHGRQKQTARLDITNKFSSSQHACLFSTDVAARGLDFPAVDWVVQVDCPEDADTYIHRVGRTARYEHEGHAVMLLDPSEEEGMLATLERQKVYLEKINVRQKKMQNTIKNQLQNMCFKDPELKYLGQKAFVSYVRSVHIQKDKSIFDVKKLDLEGYASSLGLPGAPRVKFVKGEDARARKNAPRQLLAGSSGSEDDERDGNKRAEDGKKQARTKYDRMFDRRNQDVLADHYAKMIDAEDQDALADSDRDRIQTGKIPGPDADTAAADQENEFLAVKRRFDAGDAGLEAEGGAVRIYRAESEQSGPELGQDEIRTTDPTNEDGKSSGRSNQKTIQLGKNADDAFLVDSKRREKLLKSKKALLKFKGHGSHMHFDDDGQPHEVEYYEREEEFAKKGLPTEQRQAFLVGERERTEAADLQDKAVAKRKKREKVEKRKARERGEYEDADQDGEQDKEKAGTGRVAYLNSSNAHIGRDLDALSDSDVGEIDVVAPDLVLTELSAEGKQKRKKKWFEDASSGDEEDERDNRSGHKKQKRKVRYDDFPEEDEVPASQPQTLEDLEAMAEGIIGSR